MWKRKFLHIRCLRRGWLAAEVNVVGPAPREHVETAGRCSALCALSVGARWLNYAPGRGGCIMQPAYTYRSYESLAPPPPPRGLLAVLLAALLAAQLAAYQPDAAVLRHACAALLSQGVPAERPGAAHWRELAALLL